MKSLDIPAALGMSDRDVMVVIRINYHGNGARPTEGRKRVICTAGLDNRGDNQGNRGTSLPEHGPIAPR